MKVLKYNMTVTVSYYIFVNWWPLPSVAGNALSLSSTAVDQKGTRLVGGFPGFGSVLRAFFTALTLLIVWYEGHSACKNPCHLSQKVLYQNKWGKTAKGEIS